MTDQQKLDALVRLGGICKQCRDRKRITFSNQSNVVRVEPIDPFEMRRGVPLHVCQLRKQDYSDTSLCNCCGECESRCNAKVIP